MDFILSRSTVIERAGRELPGWPPATGTDVQAHGQIHRSHLRRVPGPLLVHRHPQNSHVPHGCLGEGGTCPRPYPSRRSFQNPSSWPSALPARLEERWEKPQGRVVVEGPQPSGPKDQNSPSWPGMADPDGPEQNRPCLTLPRGSREAKGRGVGRGASVGSGAGTPARPPRGACANLSGQPL